MITPAVSEEVFNLGLGVNYHFNSLWKGSKSIDPYLKANAGYIWMMDEKSLSAGAGLGVNFGLMTILH